MSKIKISSLGGLGENGKNMFVVEVDDRIFILDAGLKYPEVDLYGIDAVIPDISYLVENKERIEGIFISHGHEDHTGALPFLLENINVRVYGTHFTICLIESLLSANDMDVSKYKLYRINETKTMKFGDNFVTFYNTTHSIPESVAIAIHTVDGVIVYAPDFNFGSTLDPRYKTSFEKITELNREGVLAVLSESIGVTNDYRANNDVKFEHKYQNILNKAQHRIIVTCFSSALSRIQRIIDMSIASGKRIAVVGKTGERAIDVAINSGYLRIPTDKLVNLRYIDDTCKNDDDDLVVIVSGVRNEQYNMVLRMLNKQDRIVQITEKDTVVFISDPLPGTERFAIGVMDELYRNDIDVEVIPKSVLKTTHATPDDLLMLYSMLKPHYIVPVIGEYRHQYRHIDVLKGAGVPEKNIVVIDNGKTAIIENKELTGYENITYGDILVDGSLIASVNQQILKEREQMSEDGAIIILVYVDSRIRKIVKDPVVITKGFVLNVPQEDFNKQVVDLFTRMLKNAFTKNVVDKEAIKSSLSDEIGKLTFRIVKKRPIIITSIIDLKK